MLGLDGVIIVGNREPLAVCPKGELDSWSRGHPLIAAWAVAVEVAELWVAACQHLLESEAFRCSKWCFFWGSQQVLNC